MSDKENKDLTRIEDLAEFLHSEEDDGLFDTEQEEEEEIEEEVSTEADFETPALPSLDDLDEEPPSFEEAEMSEEISFGSAETESFASSEAKESEEETQDDDFTQDSFSTDFNEVDSEELEAPAFEEEQQFEVDTPEEDQEPEESEEPEQEEITEDTFEPAPVEAYTPIENETPVSAPPQNFQDLRDFAENISYGAVAQGGNPPFSLILRGIRYQEDAQDILIILREHGLISDDNEQSIEQGLANGSLLISQISEYSAIYLAHRFRRFDLEVMLGLADEIHPSTSYVPDSRGLVSKESIRQNVHESFDLDRAPVKIQSIILSTTPTLEGYTIREYLGVISHHNVLSAQEIEEFSDALEPTGDDVVDAIQRDLRQVLEQHGDNIEDIRPFGQGLENLYHEMAQSLRAHALKIGANAVVGINYQLTPVIKHEGRTSDVQYKVTCLGSAVWVVGD